MNYIYTRAPSKCLPSKVQNICKAIRIAIGQSVLVTRLQVYSPQTCHAGAQFFHLVYSVCIEYHKTKIKKPKISEKLTFFFNFAGKFLISGQNIRQLEEFKNF